MDLELVIGTRQWSSWSLRAWLALKHLGIEFRTTEVPLRTPESGVRIRHCSPSGKVPVLIHEQLTIWDSLAIAEYAHELAGGAGWPGDRDARAVARSISAEMHSGFPALRTNWPMEAASTGLAVALTAEAERDVARICELVGACRLRHAGAGPWLFGDWCIADAMYAPVALRFHSYGASLEPAVAEWVATVLASAPIAEWIAAARADIRN
jgi:glutathione S-transferase